MTTLISRPPAATNPENSAAHAAARALLWSLTQHADNAGHCQPGLDLLERETGLDAGHIHDAAEWLAITGHITIVEHSSGSDFYQLHSAGVAR